jgi:hypothetical protein
MIHVKNEANLIHEQDIIYSHCLAEEECISEFQINLASYQYYNTELVDSAKVRFLFFNKLFTEIEVDQLESFLNYHFESYKFTKKDFLRTLRLDITEMFGCLIEPIRIIEGNEPGIVVEVLPFFKSYRYEEYLGYARRFKECEYWIEDKENELFKLENNTLMYKKGIIQNLDATGKKHLLKIPTRLGPDEILDFWLKLTGNDEKGEPYWESEKEIEHFVSQNFEVFPGVDEIKEFNPNMNKSELSHVTWTFFHNHGVSKTKKQYEKLLMQNFAKFKNDDHVYSNIKDQNNEHLKKLFK